MPSQSIDRPQTRPFAAFLNEQRHGALHGEISTALADVVHAVLEHDKQGSLTLTIKVKPAGDGAVQVIDHVQIKAPEGDRPAALFFADDHGNLSRNNPHQPELPLREIPTDQPDALREAN
jgi:hypothetical protein